MKKKYLDKVSGGIAGIAAETYLKSMKQSLGPKFEQARQDIVNGVSNAEEYIVNAHNKAVEAAMKAGTKEYIKETYHR